MTTEDVVGWACSAIVIFAILGYLFYEIRKRWRIGLRLAVLDESLVNDDSIIVEEVTNAPAGSIVLQGTVVEYLDES